MGPIDGIQILGKELRREPARARREIAARAAAAAIALRTYGSEAIVSLEAPLRGQAMAGSVLVASHLADLGVSSQQMILDETTRSTREEAMEGARIANKRGWGRLLVITSRYHVVRARRIFEEALGVGKVVVHVPEAFWQSAQPNERTLLAEGIPDAGALARERRVERLLSGLEMALRPLPDAWRWGLEVQAGGWLRRSGGGIPL